jgi:hypothetical protein
LASRLEDIRKQLPKTDVQASIVSTKHATKGARILALHFGIKINVVYNLYQYALQFANENLIGGAGTSSTKLTIEVLHNLHAASGRAGGSATVEVGPPGST